MNDIALAGVAVAAERGLECNDIGLHREVVLTTAKQEVAVHAPVFVVGVAHDPVFLLSLVIEAPSDKQDGVVLVLPCEATALHSFSARLFLDLQLLLVHVTVASIVLWLLFLFQRSWLIIDF